MSAIITEYPHFFTATCLEWNKLLAPDKYKNILIDSLRFLVKDERVMVYGFVIMPNHIHVVWHLKAGRKRPEVQRDFLKFTAQRIKEDLAKLHPAVLQQFRVEAKDRQYQFWERNPLSVELWTEKVVLQKLTYIHLNPVRAGLCRWPEEYKYSSALFYHTGIDNWGFLTHLRD
ncbi:transposase [Flavisolibacter sp. BT320]|nr:transposase [Flavisolibacter longurius]